MISCFMSGLQRVDFPGWERRQPEPGPDGVWRHKGDVGIQGDVKRHVRGGHGHSAADLHVGQGRRQTALWVVLATGVTCYSLQTKLREGNVFYTCLSFCSKKGASAYRGCAYKGSAYRWGLSTWGEVVLGRPPKLECFLVSHSSVCPHWERSGG